MFTCGIRKVLSKNYALFIKLYLYVHFNIPTLSKYFISKACREK